MSWISALAIFFVLWWVVLFAALPFGLRTQDDEDDVTLGTTPSAPRGPHMARAVLRTTIATLIICGALYTVTVYFGLGIDDLPMVVPEFD
ncbi:DUF1467 family protein [Mesorhizobium xinjiangense]|uniref:DUF1467 family protein n=1 Tax=Mesorhizobium xinjiangense TaxID=2678685 RepID=UPI0012EE4846|nr:DUF1467 family protein [Mesorhizobium xinjiangense]